jgi:hypothetical protein
LPQRRTHYRAIDAAGQPAACSQPFSEGVATTFDSAAASTAPGMTAAEVRAVALASVQAFDGLR